MLATLLSNLPGMVYRCRNNREWAMEFVSEGCLELTGYAAAEFMDDQAVVYRQLIHRDDQAAVGKQIQVALRDRERFQLSYRIITAAGEERWVWERGYGVFGEQGELLALEGFVTDITERKQTEELLKLSESRYRAIVEGQTELICRFLPDGKLTFVNDAYCRYFDKSREELLATGFMPMIPEEDWPYVAIQMTACNAANPINIHEHRVIRPGGAVRWVQWTDQAILNEEGDLIELQSIGRDVTDQRQAEEALRTSEERYRLLFSLMLDGFALLELIPDPEGYPTDCRYLEVNPAFEELTGLWAANLIGRPAQQVMSEAWLPLIEQCGQVAYSGEPQHFEYCLQDAAKYFEVAAFSPKPGQCAVLLEGITERKRMEEALQQLAMLDSLTDLFNRRHFFALAEREFERSQRYGRLLSLLMLDIDHFKKINDVHGHLVGDKVLQAVATTMRDSLRQVDMVCRYGGEEFMMLLPEASLETAMIVAQRLCTILASQAIATDKGSLSVTVSIGVAALAAHEKLTLDMLLDRADQALYAAKHAGRNQVQSWVAAD
ncbi:MAG: diguanylate cyclase [Candidatus Competibacteraceae bacterium]